MIGAIGLTESDEKKHSMEDNWLWYLSGVMDTAVVMTVNIKQDDRRKLNHEILPQISFSRPKEIESVFGLIEDYCEVNDVEFRVHNTENSNRLFIEKPESIENFLEPIAGGFIQQQERVDYFLDEVVPMFEGGSPDTKKEFFEIVKKYEQLRQYPIQTKSTKFKSTYFKAIWEDELE
jgi:hypothetical protein